MASGDVFGDGSVDVRLNVDELIARLQRYDQNVQTLPMDVLGALLIAEVDKVIESEGGAGTDGPWEPFAPETLRRHPRRVGGTLLQDTGALAAVQIIETTPTSVTIKSAPKYARWHLEGTRNMPKRDYFALNFADVLEEMGEIALESLAK